MRDLYVKYNWPSGKERKWVKLSAAQRVEFATNANALCEKHPDIHIYAIVVKKENVWPHIRSDANKLYNYMIKLALIQKMANHDLVTMIPDPRSVKVQSGNSLHDYLQTELWFTEKAITTLITKPQDSSTSRGIQFADMLASVVQARYEENETRAFQAIESKVQLSKLYF